MKSYKDTIRRIVIYELLFPMIFLLLFLASSAEYFSEQRKDNVSASEMLHDVNFIVIAIAALIFFVCISAWLIRLLIRLKKFEASFDGYTPDEMIQKGTSFDEIHFFCDDVLISLENPAVIKYADIVSINGSRVANDDNPRFKTYYIDVYTSDKKHYRFKRFKLGSNSKNSEETNFRKTFNLITAKNEKIKVGFDLPTKTEG